MSIISWLCLGIIFTIIFMLVEYFVEGELDIKKSDIIIYIIFICIFILPLIGILSTICNALSSNDKTIIKLKRTNNGG